MTQDNKLEIGDLVLYYSSYFMELAFIDAVTKKRAQIVFPEGMRLLIDRKTDGYRGLLKGKPNPFANMIIIPKHHQNA